VVSPSPITEITWVGHATSLIDFGDHRVLTDPLMTKRVAHLRRRRPDPPPETYDVDTVLLSHVHIDHLHLPSLRRLRPSANIITPLGSGRLLRKVGFATVTEVVVGERIASGSVTVDVVPAVHKEGRGPHSRVRAEPVGYLVEGNATRVYFPGDTDLFDGMGDLGPVDVALLPIWGWGSTLGPGHLNPQRAGAAVELIRPRIVVPIHFGTYAPEDGRRRLPRWFGEPPAHFVEELADNGHGDRLQLLEPGGRLRW
jgi:L-ascorbate metabolism protein UlaG (beta-lactamase superfamily)